MRAKVKRDPSELVLTRTLDAFAKELIDASDEEILEVAKDLGMDPTTRESAAFQGVTYPARWQLSDFFDVQAPQKQQLAAERIANLLVGPKNRSRRSKRLQLSTERKPPGGK
jgi:hypothetical protein